MNEYIIINNDNVTDARIIGRVILPSDIEMPEPFVDMAIVPDLKHEPDGWKIMNFRMVPRTHVDTRPIDER